MSDHDTLAGSRPSAPAGENAAQESGAKIILPVTAERFADVTSSLHRFMTRLVQFEPFQEAGIGIAEWSFLNEVRKEGVSGKKLQRNLGLTKQRLKQVREGLKKAGFINVGDRKSVV